MGHGGCVVSEQRVASVLFHLSVMKERVMLHRPVRTASLAKPAVGVFLQRCFIILWCCVQRASEEVHCSG